MPLTTAPLKWMMENPRPEIKTLDYLAGWCAMPKGELQNHIAWCFKRFADFTHSINHVQYFSHLNIVKFIRYNVVAAILVMFFPCNKQAVHMVGCTGSTRWRKHKPPLNGTVLLLMGTSLDCHIKSTARSISTWLKCLSVVKDAEPSFKWLLTFFQTFATEPIRPTSERVIVLQRHQPSRKPCHDWSYCGQPASSILITHIVRISTIEGAVHLLPLTPQPDSMWWYLINTPDFNAFHMFYMENIRLDSWSNHCSHI